MKWMQILVAKPYIMQNQKGSIRKGSDDSGRKLRVGDHGGVRLERHTIMSDQYPIPMIHNALNFHELAFS